MSLIVTCWDCATTVKVKGNLLPEKWRKVFGSFGAEYLCPSCAVSAKRTKQPTP